ncbi:transposase, partial [Acinetobacter baumannii ABNIH7]
PQFNANAIQDYALRWEIETYSVVSKDAGLILKIRA